MDALEKLIELDDRHNDLLEQLALLDVRIKETLNDWISGKPQQVDAEKKALPTSRIKAA